MTSTRCPAPVVEQLRGAFDRPDRLRRSRLRERPDPTPRSQARRTVDFFFPDSQDQIDPSFDFGRESSSPDRVRQRDDRYAHEVISPAPYTGILLSKALVDGPGSKYTFAQRHSSCGRPARSARARTQARSRVAAEAATAPPPPQQSRAAGHEPRPPTPQLQPPSPSAPPRTMTADAETVRGETTGPSTELTKSYY